MIHTYKRIRSKIVRSSKVMQVVLLQVFLALAAVTAWAVLRSPSTTTFFAFEIGVALVGGLFLGLRHPQSKSDPVLTNGVTLELLPEHPRRNVQDRNAPPNVPARAGFAETDIDEIPWQSGKRMFVATSSLYFIALSMAFLDLSRSLNVASIHFYAYAGFAAGVLALNIYMNGESRPGQLLLQVMLLGALLKFHFLFLNPYVYTSDTYLFYLGLLDLSSTGSLPLSLGHYFFFPASATFAFSTMSIAAVPFELYVGAGFVAQLSMLPVVYLIGRQIASRSVGLFASMFVLLSIYGFLFTYASPTHYGLFSLFLALYAAIRIGNEGSRVWFAVFWVAAIAAMLSHPVNALVLGLVLTVRVLGTRIAGGGVRLRRSSFTPALSYAIAYGSYLAFIAATAFDLFVRTFFVVRDAPPLATIPAATLERTPLFIIQSMLAPFAIILPIFFAAYSLLRRRGMSRTDHSFFVALGAAFLVIPGLEILGENFKLQSSRLLIYFAIPFAFLGAHGLVSLVRGTKRVGRAASLVIGLFVVCGFLAPSSYLTQNGLHALYTDVPFRTIHVTETALANRQFLALTPTGSIIFMDAGSLRYFDNSLRTRDALTGRSVVELSFFQASGGTGFVSLNVDLLPYGVPGAGSLYDSEAIQIQLRSLQASLIYDSGKVQVYYVP